VLVAILFTACKKESTPTAALNQKIDTAISKPQQSGEGFMNGPYGAVSGNAKIYLTDTKYQVALENFSTSNGPDLKVYLSNEINPVNFVNLGSLKSTLGDQLYDVPSSVDVKNYQYVLIFCQQYKHLFGYTKLK
jgi:hypothetical protein